MAFSPWYTGQTYPVIQFPLNTDSAPDNITGLSASAFTLIIRNPSTNPPTDQIGGGTFSIVTATPAVVNYQAVTADVLVAGSYVLIIKALFGVGQTAIYDGVPWTIAPD